METVGSSKPLEIPKRWQGVTYQVTSVLHALLCEELKILQYCNSQCVSGVGCVKAGCFNRFVGIFSFKGGRGGERESVSFSLKNKQYALHSSVTLNCWHNLYGFLQKLGMFIKNKQYESSHESLSIPLRKQTWGRWGRWGIGCYLNIYCPVSYHGTFNTQ